MVLRVPSLKKVSERIYCRSRGLNVEVVLVITLLIVPVQRREHKHSISNRSS